jgi:hypothetical protein
VVLLAGVGSTVSSDVVPTQGGGRGLFFLFFLTIVSEYATGGHLSL